MAYGTAFYSSQTLNNTYRQRLVMPGFYVSGLPTSSSSQNCYVTGVSLTVTMRLGTVGSYCYDAGYLLGPMTTTPPGWSSVGDAIYAGSSGSAFNYSTFSSYFTYTFASNTSISLYCAATGNQSYTFSMSPSYYYTDTSYWNYKTIYLGMSHNSGIESNWGTGSTTHTLTIYYEIEPIITNSAPNTPTLIYPRYKGTNVYSHTYDTQPYFKGTFTDPDGDNMTPYAAMQYVNNGTWTDYNTYSNGSTVASGNDATIYPSSALSYNTSYNVRLYAKDTSNATGGATSKQPFTVYEKPAAMSSGTSVTAADFNTLRSAVLTQTDYYVSTIPSLPNITTGTQIQVSQINALKTALNSLPYHENSQVSATNQYSNLVPANFNNTRAKLW